MSGKKEQVITFKVDDSLMEAMKGVENRSDFIRSSILAALENRCPLCRGTGIISPNQKKHWRTFCESHAVVECDDCHEMHLICSNSQKKGRAAKGVAK
jgi:hypothetical protein